MEELKFDFVELEEELEEIIEEVKVSYFPDKKKKEVKHYINNVDFCEALDNYKADVTAAAEEGKPKPRIPNYIGECFIKIAEGLSKKPNFFGYSYRDEMIADGIENCLLYFENFDSKKTKNPFAYFTQILFFCFLRRIQKEKKQQYIKYKATENFGVLDEFELQDLGGSQVKQIEVYDNMYEFIKKYEESEFKKISLKSEKDVVLKGLDNFMETL